MIRPVVYYNGSTLVDQTRKLTDPFEGSQSLDLSNYLYIATQLPLRSSFFLLETEVTTNKTITVDYYAGPEHGWVTSLQTQDETTGLSESGYVIIQPDPQKPWALVEDTLNLTELNSVRFFNWYWYRVKLDSTFTVALKWIGNKFCTTNDITRKRPDTANSRVYQSFGKSSLDWTDLIIEASKAIIRDIKHKFNIESDAQILESRDLREACVHLTASYIYAGLGPAYLDSEISMLEKYQGCISGGDITIDQNKDGRADQEERAKVTQIDFVR
jgi:hypothetical protein